jgi:hypothetical protein
VKSASPLAENEPQVGIFWLLQRRLVIDCTSLHAAEPYGDSLTHSRGHLQYWTELQRRGEVPAEVEYEEPPRGRVLFDRRNDRFVLLADRCILKRGDVVRRLMRQMHLPPERTETVRDDHYRCKICLLRQDPRE